MASELRALAEVGADAVDRLAFRPVRGVHRAVARRVFDSVGPASATVRAVHDSIAEGVYATLRLSGRALASAVGAVAAGAEDEQGRTLSRSRRGRIAISAVNALVGDLLHARGSDLAIAMAVRHAGDDVVCDRESLGIAFPAATGRLAVFVHGLAENDDWWRPVPDAAGEHPRPCFGDRLEAELGCTSVYIRYNTGLHVSENGERLCRLLDALVTAWPVPVESLALIGHSMGGLVARSACHAASSRATDWAGRTRHVVCLGTPHLGAPLEKVTNIVGSTLRAVPETRPFAEILETRSVGIKDLRFGYVCHEDWMDCDPDDLLQDNAHDAQLLPDCDLWFVTATVTRDENHPVGVAVGDLLVRSASAGGRSGGRPIPLPPERVRHVGGLTHFDLLTHPVVYAHLREALGGDPPAR